MMLDFHTLEIKYGSPTAYHLLAEMEKVAHIQSWVLVAVDPEIRLANALRTQDAMLDAPVSQRLAA